MQNFKAKNMKLYFNYTAKYVMLACKHFSKINRTTEKR